MKKECEVFTVNGVDLPYYHFIYEGEFYKYLRIRNKQYLENGMRINEFFMTKTHEQYDFSDTYTVFDKAFMIIIHNFPDYFERDLDNNSYKPVIDAVRKHKIIPNDSWQYLSLMILGNEREKESIETYVVPHDYTIEFIVNELSKINPELFRKTIFSQVTTNKKRMEESKLWR